MLIISHVQFNATIININVTVELDHVCIVILMLHILHSYLRLTIYKYF